MALGFIANEDTIPILYNKYFELKRAYVDKNYEQGPLLALYKLSERFYKQ